MKIGRFFTLLGLWMLLPVIGGAVAYFVVIPYMHAKTTSDIKADEEAAGVTSGSSEARFGHPVIQVTARPAATVNSKRFVTGGSGARKKKKPAPTTPTEGGEAAQSKPSGPVTAPNSPAPASAPTGQETIPVPGGDASGG